ncbi:hypothetical protein JNUCC22_19275 [Bacillus sp. JNUCC-22]|uniref:hypothetical protein n=1 Tax=Bacillus sp. JNUCC-22 TaxID=2842457 RepID=UPI001C08505E|nr:hypothetical protein [Bacillus sp. JNUCC-22]QWQ28444.1 hypothetical protein JNUCC22_19275 [Bacillus sp. JNUCC-22]
MLWDYNPIEWGKEVRTENARLFKGECKLVKIEGEDIRDIFWHSDTGDPIFITRLKQNALSTTTRRRFWEVTVHNPFGNDVYVEIYGLDEMKGIWVDVDTINDHPDPFIQLSGRAERPGTLAKREFWKTLDKHVEPVSHTNPIDLSHYSTTDLITLNPSGSNRRLKDIYWITQFDKDCVLLGYKKRNISDGSFEIKLHNATNNKTQVSVYGIEEEYIGKIEGAEK